MYTIRHLYTLVGLRTTVYTVRPLHFVATVRRAFVIDQHSVTRLSQSTADILYNLAISCTGVHVLHSSYSNLETTGTRPRLMKHID